MSAELADLRTAQHHSNIYFGERENVLEEEKEFVRDELLDRLRGDVMLLKAGVSCRAAKLFLRAVKYGAWTRDAREL